MSEIDQHPDWSEEAHEHICGLVDRIAEPRALLEWQPIETAPKDNPRCLVYSPNNGDIRIIPAGLIKTAYDATHWMPLPEPPKEKGK